MISWQLASPVEHTRVLQERIYSQITKQLCIHVGDEQTTMLIKTVRKRQ